MCHAKEGALGPTAVHRASSVSGWGRMVLSECDDGTVLLFVEPSGAMATGTISRSLRLLAASALFGSVQALNVTVSGRQILVDGAPWFSKGICYSPTPTGSDASLDAPYGDYQIDEYEWMWERDFALMKAMGANTIRTYAWNVTYNHTKFLDKAHENGLMVWYSMVPARRHA